MEHVTEPLVLERTGIAQLQIGRYFRPSYMFEIKEIEEMNTTMAAWLMGIAVALVSVGGIVLGNWLGQD